jgi:hypothetical protein
LNWLIFLFFKWWIVFVFNPISNCIGILIAIKILIFNQHWGEIFVLMHDNSTFLLVF